MYDAISASSPRVVTRLQKPGHAHVIIGQRPADHSRWRSVVSSKVVFDLDTHGGEFATNIESYNSVYNIK